MENASAQQTVSERTKVLFIVTKSNFGGAQRYVYDLATGMPRERFEVAVACGPAQKGASGYLVEKLSAAHIRTILVPDLARDVGFADVAAFRHLLAVIKKEKPAVLHLNSSKAGGLGALAGRMARVPRIVFTSHGLAYDEDRGFFQRTLILILTWITFLLCHAVICISSDTATRGKRLWGVAHKIHLIYNGIAPFTMFPREEARAHLCAMNPAIPRNSLWIGTISELTRNKGLLYLIDACALLKEKISGWTLIIIGVGEQDTLLKKSIQEKGLSDMIFLLGFVPDARSLLQAFDIFTLTSVKEGLPYVILEAAQAPLATLASDIPGVRDIIEKETSGILVTPKNPAAIAEDLLRLAQDKQMRHTVAYGLYERAKSSFSLSAMVENTVQLYR